MSKYPYLSEADSVIMEILWRDGEATSADILSEIQDRLNWTRQTVRTYLKRLMDKGLVKTRQINRRVFRYCPAVTREEYAADKAGSILGQYYDNLSHMVAGIVKNERIPAGDLDELEAMIQKLRKGEQ